ncbi:MAG: VWA domain-containing protein [Syntrophobacterales bacterium]|nr:MAG: VWA domain-containing protein [Syntrophobacterales bacterium]
MIRLANPSFLLMGVIFLSLLFVRKTAFLGYSHLRLLEAEGKSRFYQSLPQLIFFAAIALLILGLARPQWRRVVQYERFFARDIILVVDLSYSMENIMRSALKVRNGPRKIDVARKEALRFIQKRKNDRIGLLVFGDNTFGSWPLTRDHRLISKKVARLGSAFYGGTNLGQPFLKAMGHFRQMGQSASRVLVFLSDGQAPIPDTMKERIITEMKKMGIHLYLLGINLKKESIDILEIVDRIGGRFIATESPEELTAAFDEIDHLETSLVEIEVQGKSQELYPIFVISGLSLLFILTLIRNSLFLELC